MTKQSKILFWCIFLIIFFITMLMTTATLVKGETPIGYVNLTSVYKGIFIKFDFDTLLIILTHIGVCLLLAFIPVKLWTIFIKRFPKVKEQFK